ncbi:MAG: hypothetical protein R2769_01425 [Saprospiraceae bacterium]
MKIYRDRFLHMKFNFLYSSKSIKDLNEIFCELSHENEPDIESIDYSESKIISYRDASNDYDRNGDYFELGLSNLKISFIAENETNSEGDFKSSFYLEDGAVEIIEDFYVIDKFFTNPDALKAEHKWKEPFVFKNIKMVFELGFSTEKNQEGLEVIQKIPKLVLYHQEKSEQEILEVADFILGFASFYFGTEIKYFFIG